MIKPKVKFTPELLITAPRNSPASPNSTGKYAFYSVSTYSLDSHSETKEVKVIDLDTEEVTLFSDDPNIASIQWLAGHQLLWTRKVSGGKTELWIGTAGNGEKNAYLAGTIDSSISNIKIKDLGNGVIAIAFTALVGSNGALYNAESAPKPLSTAREYESSLVRYFDTYFGKEQSTIWYTTLEDTSIIPGISKYSLSKKLINALEGTNFNVPTWPTTTGMVGDDGEIDLSGKGIIFLALDPEEDPAHVIAMKLWYAEVEDFASGPTGIHEISAGFKGVFTAPVWSVNGKSLAFLVTESLKVPGGFNRIFVVPCYPQDAYLVEIVPPKDQWDLNAASIFWSTDGTEIYVSAEDRARQRLWKISLRGLPSQSGKLEVTPTLISGDSGSVSSAFSLNKRGHSHKLFINTTSFVDNGSFYTCNPAGKDKKTYKKFAFNDVELGLHRSQISEINFEGEGKYDVHAWIYKPSGFDEKKKYPLAFLIHGGPTATWADAWSTRWNPAVWAEQGYVVVLPNPSGSSSFGKDFQNSVMGDWGGRPYGDLVACLDYIEATMPFVDTSRAIAAGGSYGGYMANWIAGQPLAKRFKTLISHDGIFSNYSMLASDVPIMLKEDLGGLPWNPKAKELWNKFDPAQFTENWSTPMLIIHSDNDFRCPISEGLAAYNVCQMKGIPSRFLNFPDENHFVLGRENSLRWYKTVLGWANKYADVEGGVKLEDPVTEPRSRAFRKPIVIRRDRW